MLSKKRLNKIGDHTKNFRSADANESLSDRDSEPQSLKQTLPNDSINTSPKHKVHKLESDDVRLLSNTHMFERGHEPMDSAANRNIRKSMNNIKLSDSMHSNSAVDERAARNSSKQTANMSLKQPPKPQINNSSSQSSLGGMTGIVDLGNKRRSAMGQSIASNNDDDSTESFAASQPSSKPSYMAPHAASSKTAKQAPTRTFEEHLTKQSQTTNPVIKHQTDSSSDSEEDKAVHNIGDTIQVARQEQLSDSDERDEHDEHDERDTDNAARHDDNEQDSDDEFPVALNGLVFSFLPQEVAERLNNSADWK